jgi:hypothetical protein
MSESESTSRWVELVREDEGAASTEFVYAFEWLQTSHYILLNNVRELLAIPERFASDRSLLAYENRAGRETLLLEFVRRLHNYLAAVKTLVDHTRTFRSRHVCSPSFDSECERRLQQLRDTPVVKFLQEFRNPVLHSQLPRVALTTTDQNGQLRRQLTLSVAETLAMHTWSVSARQYIDEAQEGTTPITSTSTWLPLQNVIRQRSVGFTTGSMPQWRWSRKNRLPSSPREGRRSCVYRLP